MTIYTAPTRDMQFLLHDVLQVSAADLPGHADLDREFTEAILEAAGQLASDMLVPLNAVGDQQEPEGSGSELFARHAAGLRRHPVACRHDEMGHPQHLATIGRVLATEYGL